MGSMPIFAFELACSAVPAFAVFLIMRRAFAERDGGVGMPSVALGATLSVYLFCLLHVTGAGTVHDALKFGVELNPTQLNAIFNHAERYYDLTGNPCRKVTKMGSKKGGEMNFWTKQEYLRFSEAIMDKPLSFYAFEVLYWTGIRCGELLAHTPSDFIFETSELSITKS